MQARTLLNSLSPTSFITEHLAQHLGLPHKHRRVETAGIGGVLHNPSSSTSVSFGVSGICHMEDARPPHQLWGVEAVVLTKITAPLQAFLVSFDRNWRHLTGVCLVDPDFGIPGPIDILLGVDGFSHIILHGRQKGPSRTLSVLETRFKWVLSGTTQVEYSQQRVVACFLSVSTHDFLKCFWEVENCEFQGPPLTMDKQAVKNCFNFTYTRDERGRFIVPLPKKEDAKPLEEPQSLAVRKFTWLEQSLRAKGKFLEVIDAVQEYIEQGHAEPVHRPSRDLENLGRTCSIYPCAL